jgi:hypothetical protein
LKAFAGQWTRINLGQGLVGLPDRVGLRFQTLSPDLVLIELAAVNVPS